MVGIHVSRNSAIKVLSELMLVLAELEQDIGKSSRVVCEELACEFDRVLEDELELDALFAGGNALLRYLWYGRMVLRLMEFAL